MKLLSFRLKIALLSALISGVVLLGFGAASWYLIYRQKVAAVDTEIRSLGARHPGWLANRWSLRPARIGFFISPSTEPPRGIERQHYERDH